MGHCGVERTGCEIAVSVVMRLRLVFGTIVKIEMGTISCEPLLLSAIELAKNDRDRTYVWWG